jgi:hypothetical protein
MTRAEFIKKTEHYHGRIGDMDIVLDNYSSADFILGCYYDKETRTWKVYKNGERGIGGIRLETASEEEALKKLYSMIEFENKMFLRYKEWEAKKRKNEQW